MPGGIAGKGNHLLLNEIISLQFLPCVRKKTSRNKGSWDSFASEAERISGV